MENRGKCPKCGKRYTNIRRPPTTAGEYDLLTGELEAPPCLACAKKDDRRSEEYFKTIAHKESL